MGSEYTYIPVAERYFCCQCNLASLAWALLVKNKGRQLGIQRCQVPNILMTIIKYRNHPQAHSTRILLLPTPGHLCMRVHRGYKVFNFSKSTTTKVFDHDLIESKVLSEIESVRDAGLLGFAPELLEVDSHNQWYREAFVDGIKGSKNESSDPKSLYDSVIVGHLSKMIMSKPVQTVKLVNHIKKIRNLVNQHLTSSRIDNELTTYIKDFIQKTYTALEKNEDVPIQLAFTHGDFSFVNFVQKDKDVMVIDWEGAEHRSMLHDLYNYFLTELYYDRSQSNLTSEIDGAILLLSQRIDISGAVSPKDLINLKNVYRWVYYLERIEILLDREISDGILKVIRHSIDIFNKHEIHVLKNKNT